MSIKKLNNLNYLTLSHNQIGKLPRFVKNLIHLNGLVIDNNNLRKLPRSIKKLTELETIKLSQNPIKETRIIKIKKRLPQCEVVF